MRRNGGEMSGRAAKMGSVSQDGQTCNKCVHRKEQHSKITVWTIRMIDYKHISRIWILEDVE